MHNTSKHERARIGSLGGFFPKAEQSGELDAVLNGLLESIQLARAAGVLDEQIILDPGIGFGKNPAQNLSLINHLDRFKVLGYPLLAGPSRKSFIGLTLELPPDERLEGTAAAVTACILRGADIVRVHDVRFMKRIATMTDAILGHGTEMVSGLIV
jgi:dihydropteroate synthase